MILLKHRSARVHMKEINGNRFAFLFFFGLKITNGSDGKQLLPLIFQRDDGGI